MSPRSRKISPLIWHWAAVCVLLLFCAASGAYRFDSWTTDNSLPQNSVFSIVQTPDGYLWLTTLDGLARFDGVRFTVFNPKNSLFADNRVKDVFTDREGTLWIATDTKGLYRVSEQAVVPLSAASGRIHRQAGQGLLFPGAAPAEADHLLPDRRVAPELCPDGICGLPPVQRD